MYGNGADTLLRYTVQVTPHHCTGARKRKGESCRAAACPILKFRRQRLCRYKDIKDFKLSE